MNLIFDRKLIRIRRNNIAKSYDQYNFLYKIACETIAERVYDSKRQFENALVIGATDDYLRQIISEDKINNIVFSDISENMLNNFLTPEKLVFDPEFIPFKPESFDLVLSPICLHMVNDIPGCFIQIKNILKQDGIFIANIFGGESMQELRDIMAKAEIEVTGGLSPRVIPFIEIKDLGMLLQRAGFYMPVTDSDNYIVHYPNILQIFKDLKNMGESNSAFNRGKTLSRRIIAKTEELYRQNYLEEGSLKLTYQIINLTGIKA